MGTMLKNLYIKNLAIVEKVSIEFTEGLNIITGETGTGKSLLIGGIALATGEKADKNIIRTGADSCEIEAVFEVEEGSIIHQNLKELGLSNPDDLTLIIRREISKNSATRIFINDTPVNLQTLKRIGEFLVDLHGPHEHQSLLKTEFQRQLLDSFAMHEELISKYHSIFDSITSLNRKKEELISSEKNIASEIDYLEYIIKEIEEANLSQKDETDLEEEYRKLTNAAEIVKISNEIVSTLTESNISVFSQLAGIIRKLSSIEKYLVQVKVWKEELEKIVYNINDISQQITDIVSNLDVSESALQQLEERMSLIHKLKSKYGKTINEILKKLNESKHRLKELKERSLMLSNIEKELITQKSLLMEIAKELSESRKKSAKKLIEKILLNLKHLGFTGASFDIHFEPCELYREGAETVEFLFTPNPGESIRPLRTIASSGELSRIMLAIKSVLAEHDRIPTLVFDEIDANVGGEMGSTIGQKLSSIAKTHQVICITHLPQVAVFGKTHLAVRKNVRSGRTYVDIATLNHEERILEIARMLSGEKVTDTAIQHAKNLLKQTSKL